MKLKDANSIAPLLDCLEDIKAKMALNVVKFSEVKTNVFGPGGACESPYLDLGAIKPYVKPTVKHLGVIMDSDFKLDKQIK